MRVAVPTNGPARKWNWACDPPSEQRGGRLAPSRKRGVSVTGPSPENALVPCP